MDSSTFIVQFVERPLYATHMLGPGHTAGTRRTNSALRRPQSGGGHGLKGAIPGQSVKCYGWEARGSGKHRVGDLGCCPGHGVGTWALQGPEVGAW